MSPYGQIMWTLRLLSFFFKVPLINLFATILGPVLMFSQRGSARLVAEQIQGLPQYIREQLPPEKIPGVVDLLRPAGPLTNPQRIFDTVADYVNAYRAERVLARCGPEPHPRPGRFYSSPWWRCKSDVELDLSVEACERKDTPDCARFRDTMRLRRERGLHTYGGL